MLQKNPAKMLEQYQPEFGGFDEMRAPTGELRLAWETLLNASKWPAERLEHLQFRAARMFHESGTVYSAYGDPENVTRGWQLDPIPLMIAAEEWDWLERGLIERAELIDQVLKDIHGPQELLSRNVYPPELVYSHPSFQHAFCHANPSQDRMLRLFAVDLARTEDGRWCVIGDRTDSPTGMGYVLENRIVQTRLLSRELHSCSIQRLGRFFVDLQSSLRPSIERRQENPRTVLLSAGPSRSSYFEDVYLARYLSYPLVEAADLTVRDRQVWWKTLGGLLPVDVIFRRVSDQAIDPLEVHAGGQQGIPGLLQAIRAGNVQIVNPLGSSLLESPAWLAWLDRIATAINGSQLQIPSVSTCWPAVTAIDQQLPDFQTAASRLRSAFRVSRKEPLADYELANLSNEAKAKLFRERPEQFVFQQHVKRSTAPVWLDSKLQSLHVAWRVYLVAEGDGYQVLPGGLVRLSADSNELAASVLSGEVAKDAWVVTSRPIDRISLLPAFETPTNYQRGGAEMPSRVADSLYWLGRQLERADATVCLVRAIVASLISESSEEGNPQVEALLRTMASTGQIEPSFVIEGMRDPLPALEEALPSLVLSPEYAGNLYNIVQGIYRNAGNVRDRLSRDTWRVIQRLEDQVADGGPKLNLEGAELLDRLDEMVIEIAAIGGMIDERMTRTLGWRFLEIGRRLERAMAIISLLVHSIFERESEETEVLSAVLEVAGSSMTYRSRYRTNVRLPDLLDLLLSDQSNPRSLVFQLVRLSGEVDRIFQEASIPQEQNERDYAEETLTLVSGLTADNILGVRAEPEAKRLRRRLEQIALRLSKLSQRLTHQFLTHTQVERHMWES